MGKKLFYIAVHCIQCQIVIDVLHILSLYYHVLIVLQYTVWSLLYRVLRIVIGNTLYLICFNNHCPKV